MHDPINLFNTIWLDAKCRGTSKHRNAVCVSTIDEDGYPNSRFVDLKEANAAGFVFCSPLDSGKALDICRNPKTGITLWWEHIATQVRIKGLASPISDQEAKAHWVGRLRDAQIATATFQQSRPLASLETLSEQYARAVAASDGKSIPRPDNWGGFRLCAEYIEFLEFKENRLHARTAYSRVGTVWEQHFLQP
ncbi:pyridoxamine 5'-phosphate oxidase [Lampropedia puyangensis]|uniref:Pyridoxamine 5'-phosphate oxidase n=1 Tax=Lampropedia puyangensis TaxID=1330072 RepID=A0A4S8F010_9BURK|nr:pyridoxal 5'-phosphate synthase [Lampropedia puyangensis]THU00209.1 pyridoxamine 5'-phosphate oxidase [Lampropedia puyangensis]